jgi:hypothetical protein
MNRIEQMQPSIMWVLFMTTCLVHIFTFFILQAISDKFGMYITRPDITLVKGINETVESSHIKKKTKQSNDQSETHSADQVANTHDEASAPGVNHYKRGKYQQLHETFDVSVFR